MSASRVVRMIQAIIILLITAEALVDLLPGAAETSRH